MSLQVWLPLNKEGDFKNRGLHNLSSLNNEAVYSQNGKIGGCYTFDKSQLKHRIYNSSNNLYTKLNNHSFSICAWIKTNINLAILHITYGIRFFPNNMILYCSGNLTSVTSSKSSIDNLWHHVVGTYDVSTNKMSFYRDGELTGVTNYTYTNSYASSWTNGIWIGKDPNASSESYWFNGSINDIRIYDHCLSPKEVEEISKGLVLHYPMNLEGLKLVWWNQLINSATSGTIQKNGITFEPINNGISFHIYGTATDNTSYSLSNMFTAGITGSHTYYMYGGFPKELRTKCWWQVTYYDTDTHLTGRRDEGIFTAFKDYTNVSFLYVTKDTTFDTIITPQLFDLTAMFGAGKEPTAEQFRKMYPCDYYPYCAGEWRYANKGQWVNFNQKIKCGLQAIWGHYGFTDYSYDPISNTETFTAPTGGNIYIYNLIHKTIDKNKYLIAATIKNNSSVFITLRQDNGIYPESSRVPANSDWQFTHLIYTAIGSNYAFNIRPSGNNAPACSFSIKNPICINLTQMFGEGNEPTTIKEFKALYPNEYYEYVESRYEDTGGYYEGGEVIPHIPDTAFEDFSIYGNKMFDTSGYSNNGTITGNLVTVQNSPRYDKSTLAENTSAYSNIKCTNFNLQEGPTTLSFWSKPTINSTVDTSKIQITYSKNYFFTYINYPYFVHNGDYKYKYKNYWSDGNWHFVTGIFDGINTKIYIDGLDINPNTSTSESALKEATTQLNTMSLYFRGNNISDFRIYATALTPEQIKELYNTSMYMTKNGPLTYEFIEDNKTDINKQGILSSPLFVELNSEPQFYKDKIIANNFIEF